MTWRHAFHHLNRHHNFPKELRNFFWAKFFFWTGNGLLFLAGPIYQFELGQKMEWLSIFGLGPLEQGIIFVLGFFFLARFTMLFTIQPVSHLIAKIGLAHSMVIGLLAYSLRFFLYDFFLVNPWTIPLSILATVIGVHFLWQGHHTYFNTEAKSREIGTEVGTSEFLTRLASVIAPLVGALLAARFGFTMTIWIGVVCYFAAIALILTLPNLRIQNGWNWGHLRNWLRSREKTITGIAMAAKSWEEAGIGLFWPIFLFVTFGNLQSVGYILSAASFLSLLIVYLSGWVFDHNRHQSNRIQILSGVVLSVLWIPRLVLTTFPIMLVLNDALDRLVHSVYATLFDSNMLTRARGKDVFHFYVNREFFISLFQAAAYGLSILLVLSTGWSWVWLFMSFLLGGLVSLTFLYPNVQLPIRTMMKPSK